MNVRIQQLNPTIGDLQKNKKLILEAIHAADKSDIGLLILPEMAVVGYPPLDLLERPAFLHSIYEANEDIVKATAGKASAIIFGSVTPNPTGFGRKCFNSALVVQNGEVVAEVHKSLLPTYDIYDELRYFEPNEKFEPVEINGVKLGVTICEDIWHNESDIQYHVYEVNPAAELAERGAEAIINVSASPFTKTKPVSRQKMLLKHAENLKLPIFYANQVGGNTELVFDGDSMIINAEADIVVRCPLFEEALADVDWQVDKGTVKKVSGDVMPVPATTEGMFKALVVGLREYLAKTGVADKVVLGLSGGIDSALTACIAVEAIGPENVLAVTMPSEFSSEGSVSDSEKLAQNLGIKLNTLTIKQLYRNYLDVLDPLFSGTEFGVAEENLQSRIRGALLMAISNKFGHLLLNTGNKSELATGYCTLYGDMAGGLGVIADLYKLEVFEMSRWLNKVHYGSEIIPANIIEKPPSAELKPDQKDSDSLPDYEVLDAILEGYIEKQQSVEEISGQGYKIDTVRQVIDLVDKAEFKRFQAPPALKVAAKSFGRGRRWPMVQNWRHDR